MGNCIQIVSVGASVIADEKTWVESDAIQQLIKTSQLPDITHAVGMPDLHPGRGYPVGAAFLSKERIYPALIGNDIGCGMSFWSTDLPVHKVKLDKLEKRIGNIDFPLDDSWQDLVTERLGQELSLYGTHLRSLGTIGGGNHFAELQALDKVYSESLFSRSGIEPKKLALLVHSGSRGLGEQILRKQIDQYSHNGLEVGTDGFNEYIRNHNAALNFAELNREIIAQKILANIRAKGQRILDVNHNLLEPYFGNPDLGWVHRKGATPADKGMVMIPGSRGDFSYLVKPKPSENSLLSLAHGAGRKWIRNGCKDRLSHKYSIEQMKRTDFGGRVICESKELLYEEAPQAYKDIDSIIDALLGADLVELVARFRPILTYKTRRSGC